MKILMYIRHDYQENIAGDSILVIKTKEYLIQAGMKVAVSSNPNEDLKKYDLVHLFNTINVLDTYKFFINAMKYKKKVVLTPIYWNYVKYLPNTFTNALKASYWQKYDPLRKEVFKGVDLLLPSSESEMREIEKNFNINLPYKVVFNGVDKTFAEGNANDFLKQLQIENFVLSVGRISPHKNQLTLAKVTKKLGVPLVLVGPINDLNYYHQCMKINKDILYIPKINHSSLKAIYAAAKVHALISWYEIPGLVSLEAALGKCNIVTTKEGSTKEYFKDFAVYVDPYDLEEIENKVLESLKKSFNTDFKKYILEKFLWEKVVEKLISCYTYVTKVNG
ncbi:glycosyltransferase [Clostridium formicaceticum]|uniref:Glycosyl transferases group 1 n=1 Tax=Clostridium formicaceticum TaxID=1497 RepID=A0AAC9WG59_9CLOT|nr:glycosyltransferase [Clostridium formicaceticum]AOY76979.1 hypothetical protein BJL90_14610 [Clostridium formicaceticum]ARE87464.1 Glycosyl transferases group 1 [Clostridium formicaceticum]